MYNDLSFSYEVIYFAADLIEAEYLEFSIGIRL